MADDRIQRPNLPYVPERYDKENEAAFRREVVTLYAEVDAALFRLAQTLSASVTPHATNHEPGGSDVISLSLEDLNDVSAYSALGAGEIIKWSGSAWIHNTLAEAGIAAASHTHTASEVTDFSTAADARIAAANLEDLGDVDAYATLGAGEVLKWSGTGWVHNTLAEAGISATGHTHVEANITDLQAYLLNITGEPLSDLQDVTITGIASGELLKWNGSAWINNTLAEAGIEPALGNPASDGYILSSTAAGARSWIANSATVSSLADVGDVDAYATPASGEVLMWDGDSWLHRTLVEAGIAGLAAANTFTVGPQTIDLASGNAFFVADSVAGTHRGLEMYTAGTVRWSLRTQNDTESGSDAGSSFDLSAYNDAGTLIGSALNINRADLAATFNGSTVTFNGTQDIVITPGAVPKIASTGIMQLDAASGNYLYFTVNGSTVGTWGVDYLTLGSSTLTDLKIHEPTAGEWTIEAQSTNDLVLLAGSNEVRVDDANVLVREGADVARVKLHRANTSLASPSAVAAADWIGDLQWLAYDDAGYDLVALIRAIASQTQTATLHGTDLVFYATPDGSATAAEQFRYDATDDLVEIIADNGLVLDNSTAILEIQSAADAKIILREDAASGWNRIDFYELTDRHGYLGFGTGNEFFIVNEESGAVLKLETTGGGQIQIDDGGTNDGRVASIKAITTSTSTPTGDYPYGCLHLIY